MKKTFETALLILGTLGWWGFVYPELSLTKEYLEYEQAADSEKIRMKSYVAEYICQIRDNRKEDIEDDQQKCPYWGF